MSTVLLAQFEKRFPGGIVVQADFARPIDRFSITVLFGPSGCGKTTTLRCLAGLERPERGRICFGEETWFDAAGGVFLSPQQRGIGYLFQDYALFPHLTVAQNIAYGIGSTSRLERRRRVAVILDRFQLKGLEDRYPSQVSGGQQQRIALARVLVRRPSLLLLDEPLSALDNPTRWELRSELRRCLSEFGIPVVLVTHDRIEAASLADHLIVLNEGGSVQHGSVAEVFDRPADLAVARILGIDMIQPGRIIRVEGRQATVAVGNVQLSAEAREIATEEVYVCIRAEDVGLRRVIANPMGSTNQLQGVIRSLVSEGSLMRVSLDCGFPLVALAPRSECEDLELRTGETITALLGVSCVHLIAKN